MKDRIEKVRQAVADTSTDEELAASACEGNRSALERLVSRHRNWVFTLSHRMLWNQEAAEDAAQEILMKMVSGLSSFENRSAFRTWLYRIAVNHLLRCRQQSRAEQSITGFACYEQCLRGMPEQAYPIDSPEAAAIITEAAVGCTTAMLLCLSREQRIVYLLGEMFELPDTLCATVLDSTPDGFRKTLSRARRDLHTFLMGNCGLVNPENPCRCSRKTAEFIRLGIVDPNRLQFAPHATEKFRRAAAAGQPILEQVVTGGLGALFRDHAVSHPPDTVGALRDLVTHPRLRILLNLDPL